MPCHYNTGPPALIQMCKLVVSLCNIGVSDHPRHPADGHGGSVDPGGHAGPHCLVSHGPHQVFTIGQRCCQGRI